MSVSEETMEPDSLSTKLKSHPNVKSFLVISSGFNPEHRKLFNDYLRRYSVVQRETGEKNILYVWKDWSSLTREEEEDTKRIYDLFNHGDLDNDEIEDDDDAPSSYKSVRVLVRLSVDNEYELQFDEKLFEQLAGLFDYIIIITSATHDYYVDCMLNRVSVSRFQQYWAWYAKGLQFMVDHIMSAGIESRKLLIVDSYDEYASTKIRDLLERGTRSGSLLRLESVLGSVRSAPKVQNNQFLKNLIGREKGNLQRIYGPLVIRWFKCLLDDKLDDESHYKCIDEILLHMKCRHGLSAESNTALKEFLSSNSNRESKRITSVLIAHAVKMVQKLNQQSAIADKVAELKMIKRVLSIGSFLELYCTHFVFKHRVFNDENFIKLLSTLLQSSNTDLKMKGTRLIEAILKSDHKRYGSLFIEYDRAHSKDQPNKSFPRLLFDVLMDAHELMCDYYDKKAQLAKQAIEQSEKPAEEAPKQDEEPEIPNVDERTLFHIVEGFSYHSLSYLLKGSPENCSKLSIDDYQRLVKLALRSTENLPQKRFKLRLYRIVDVINRYGLSKAHADFLWTKIHHILKDLNKLVVAWLDMKNAGPLLKNLTPIYKELLSFIESFKHTEADESSSSSENEDEGATAELKTEESSALSKEAPRANLFESYLDLRGNRIAVEGDHPYDMLKQKQDIARVMLENERLRSETEALAKELAELRKNSAILKEENENLQADRVRLKKELSDSKTEQISQETARQPPQSTRDTEPRDPPPVLPPVSDLSADEMFKMQIIAKNSCENKDEAKKFIELIAKKHQTSTDYRGLICGTLRHLSASLYTSPVHFLSEIIQNFEDNAYDSSTKPWFLKIVMSRDYLLFCNNERGFTPENVRSLCSLAESTKKMGQHNGHKGIGFKSVFLCTDNPIVVSKPFWSFEFHKKEGQDEMAYITPNYIDLDASHEPASKYHVLKSELQVNKNCNTFMLLPLKEAYKYSESNPKSMDYFNEIVASINGNVLLFTKKLEKIILDDRINNRTVEFTCQRRTAETAAPARDDEIISCNSTIQIETIDASNNSTQTQTFKYHICKRRVQIPSELAKEEGYPETESKHMNEITLGFPDVSLVNQRSASFPVFAFLPVSDLGFRFIINCYWSLVTSRESINEHSRLNQFLVDKIAELFEWAAVNDSEVKSNLMYYLPRATPEMSTWWKLFVNDIKVKLKPIVASIFSDGQTKSRHQRIYNERMRDLIDDEKVLLDGANYQLLHPSETSLNDSELEYYFKKFSMVDLIDCISTDSEIISHWLDTRSKEWWELFFRLLNRETFAIDLDKIKSARIFRLRPSYSRQQSVSQRTALDLKSPGSVFTCKDPNFRIWFNGIQIVDFDSFLEEKFLKETLKLGELQPGQLIEAILMRHIGCEIKSAKEAWKDLSYVKENFEVYQKLVDSKDSVSSNALLLPVKSNSGTNFLPSSHAYLPSIFSIDISKLNIVPNDANCRFVFFESLREYFTLKLADILEWELFFVELGCVFPVIDSRHLRARLDVSDPALPLLPQLDSFDPSSASLAFKLADLVGRKHLGFQETFKYLPIKAEHQSNPGRVRFPVSSVCNKSVFRGLLPSINVPEHAYEFAEMLGVSVRLSFESCLKVLKTLVEIEYKEIELYIEWFLNLRTFISNKYDFGFDKVKLLHLQKANDPTKGQFYKLSDIYCCDESPAVNIICSYLDKTLINFNLNKAFKPIETVLVDLGCRLSPQLGDVVKCICRMAPDKTLFSQQNPMSYLVSTALQSFREVYLFMEKCLEKVFKLDKYAGRDALYLDLIEREEIGRLVREQMNSKTDQIDFDISKLDFPLVTCDAHLVSYSNQRLFACFQIDILQQMKTHFSTDSLYLDVSIARSCPHVMALLNVNYLNDIITVELTHENNNIEEENRTLTNIFRTVLKQKDLEIFRVKYIGTSIYIRNDAFMHSGLSSDPKNQNQSANDDLEGALTSDENETRITVYNEMQYAIFEKKHIYVRKAYDSTIKTDLALCEYLLRFAYKTFKPTLSNDEIKTETHKYISNIKSALEKQKWLPWSNSIREATRMKLSDLMFEMDGFNENDLTDVYSAMDSVPQIILQEQMSSEDYSTSALATPLRGHAQSQRSHWTNPDYMADEDIYDQTLKTKNATSRPPKNFDRLQKFEKSIIHEVNNEMQKKIGIKAEHFFCRYLKNEYGAAFNEFSNWVSSARQVVYPTASRGNDGLGYDFIVNDFKNLFTSEKCSSDKNTKTCFIEVKGTAYEWDGTFHISKNELEQRDRINKDYQSYIVVIVENVEKQNEIQITRIIDLTHENFTISSVKSQDSIVNLEADSYLATMSNVVSKNTSISNKRDYQVKRPRDERAPNAGQASNQQSWRENKPNQTYQLNNQPTRDNNPNQQNQFNNQPLRDNRPEPNWRQNDPYPPNQQNSYQNSRGSNYQYNDPPYRNNNNFGNNTQSQNSNNLYYQPYDNIRNYNSRPRNQYNRKFQ